ncbi:MAG: HEAT repeat domain-containing protein [Planctomycetes bacterium]|nr:HEAT repeat domain-containing protein [Planctomycetota bacterium]
MTTPGLLLRSMALVALMFCSSLVWAADEPASRRLELQPNDHVCIIGNTLAERMQYFGNFETMLHLRFPQHQLVVRDLGWSADELTLRPRSKDFDDHGHRLGDHQADVVIAMFGFDESFAGPEGLAKFEADLEKFITETITTKYNGRATARLALISPIAHENLNLAELPDGSADNKNLELYTASMQRVAEKHGVPFVDLFHPTQTEMAKPKRKSHWTINGVHLNEKGDFYVAQMIDTGLFGPRTGKVADPELIIRLQAEVNEKNTQFFFDYRAVNGFYIYGGRKNPFGVVNFPAEFAKLRKMIANRDQRVWAVAQGKSVPDKIDDSNTGAFTPIETNYKNEVALTTPEQSRQKMELAEGFQVNLFASEVEFPDLEKPVQMAFDARGRLWVCTMNSYPMYLPGTPPNDRILILEDTNGDGRADKCTTFADKLHLPTGMEFGKHGVYVAQQPNMMFLQDTDGDDRADVRELVLHGFDSADSHHSISAFVYDPGGALYFEEGTFHHTQVETPYGPRRCANAGVFRWEPRTWKFDVFVSYGFANPWGHCFDAWGQDFVADASGGANYFAAAFSGDVDYPNKHGGLKQFLQKQWRPTSGCELVSSKHFPEENQGNYLLNNCIGFQGVLQYKMRDDGSGFAADPVDPLLRSSDPNFRPVDLEFGPDGALYVVDWYNPLVGHMQHSVRDPNRDHTHGRVWRITHKSRPLSKPAKIAGEPIAALLDLLKQYEDRVRYRARIELGNRPTADVIAALDVWVDRLDKSDANYEHNLLEALWIRQWHDRVDEEHLRRMLKSSDYRARAAATRVLCYWRDRVASPVETLRKLANDEHPRVRLEAIRALSFFRTPEALAAACESLLYPQDEYLVYTLKETTNTLERRIKEKNPQYSVAAPVSKLLASGRAQADQTAALIDVICQRGNADELATVFQAAVSSKSDDASRERIFNQLADTAQTRKVKPAGDLSPLGQFVSNREGRKVPTALRAVSIKLASLWRVSSITGELAHSALDAGAEVPLRKAAIEGLILLGGKSNRDALEQLTAASQPMPIRILAAGGLVKLDVKLAARHAADIFAQATTKDDTSGMLAAFLNQRGGADALGAALRDQKLNVDVAKLALRYMYSVGRSDADLSAVLSSAAGIASDPPPPTPEEVSRLVAEVSARGDAKRGEQVFRRADLSCTKCHSLNKAGGDIGPELTTVGAVSPVDYVINSILQPDLAIKEQYLTRIIQTNSGEVHTGIVASRDNLRVLLKEASGQVVSIPTADIDEEAEGKSLMPKGLAKFLTHDELIDLVKFISELGKPGPYALRSTPIVQRWRVMEVTRGKLKDEAPSAKNLGSQVLNAPADKWKTVYALFSGELPLAEAASGTEPAAYYLLGEFNLVQAGVVRVDVEAPAGFTVYLDDTLMENKKAFSQRIQSTGKHKITVRVPAVAKAGDPLGAVRVKITKPADSAAQYDVVGGP